MYLVINMALFWITECIPLYLTSVFPIIFLPLFGILVSKLQVKLITNLHSYKSYFFRARKLFAVSILQILW